MASEKIRLFALLIGINSYKVTHPDFRRLRGAVADAEGFKKYLEYRLNVPENQITSLINENATRSKIIDALKHLRENNHIEKDDAIVLYYAGHGALIPDPRVLDPEDAKKTEIQCIVPYDCDAFDESRKKVPPIPDYILEILLSEIAKTKGDNITVVFDCCHSASGTRDAKSSNDTNAISRSVELSSSAAYFEQLRQEFLEMETISRGAYAPSKFSGRGLDTHVLLSACGSAQQAREDKGRGLFTAALLKLLDQVLADTLCYSEILTHPLLDYIPHQNPQCEGLHVKRILFNAKVHPAQGKSFRISRDTTDHPYVVHGGEIHNIDPDSKFSVYRQTDVEHSLKIGTLLVNELHPFSFTAKLSSDSAEFDLDQPTIAVQVDFGKQEYFRIYIPPVNRFHDVYDGLVTTSTWVLNNVLRVVESKDAQVEIALTSNSEVTFTMYTNGVITAPKDISHLNESQVEIISMTTNEATFTMLADVKVPYQADMTQDDIKADLRDLETLLSSMTHFYRELKYANDDAAISPFIDVELYKLQEHYTTDATTSCAVKGYEIVGPNLCGNHVIDLRDLDSEQDIPYGIRLVNRSTLGLHANVFYFNNYDLSISCFAASHKSQTADGVDIILNPEGGILDIGFGTAGYSPISFEIAHGLDIEVGFLKVYLSTHSVDLSYLIQPTPFTSARGARPHKGKAPVNWANIVIPVILRQH